MHERMGIALLHPSCAITPCVPPVSVVALRYRGQSRLPVRRPIVQALRTPDVSGEAHMDGSGPIFFCPIRSILRAAIAAAALACAGLPASTAGEAVMIAIDRMS